MENKEKENKVVVFINRLRIDKKDHNVLGSIMNYLVVIGFVVGCFFSLKTGFITADIIGVGLMAKWGYTEYQHSKKKERKSELLDWYWNSVSHIQTLIPINIIWFYVVS